MAQILGGISGVFLFTIFFNFIIRKIRHSDTAKQRLAITICVTILSMIVNTSNLRKIGVNLNEILDGIVIYILGGVFTSYIFALRLKKSKILFSFLYAVVFWLAISTLISIFVAFIGITDNVTHILIGMASVICSSIISPILVIKQKLPLTKVN